MCDEPILTFLTPDATIADLVVPAATASAIAAIAKPKAPPRQYSPGDWRIVNAVRRAITRRTGIIDAIGVREGLAELAKLAPYGKGASQHTTATTAFFAGLVDKVAFLYLPHVGFDAFDGLATILHFPSDLLASLNLSDPGALHRLSITCKDLRTHLHSRILAMPAIAKQAAATLVADHVGDIIPTIADINAIVSHLTAGFMRFFLNFYRHDTFTARFAAELVHYATVTLPREVDRVVRVARTWIYDELATGSAEEGNEKALSSLPPPVQPSSLFDASVKALVAIDTWILKGPFPNLYSTERKVRYQPRELIGSCASAITGAIFGAVKRTPQWHTTLRDVLGILGSQLWELAPANRDYLVRQVFEYSAPVFDLDANVHIAIVEHIATMKRQVPRVEAATAEEGAATPVASGADEYFVSTCVLASSVEQARVALSPMPYRVFRLILALFRALATRLLGPHYDVSALDLPGARDGTATLANLNDFAIAVGAVKDGASRSGDQLVIDLMIPILTHVILPHTLRVVYQIERKTKELYLPTDIAFLNQLHPHELAPYMDYVAFVVDALALCARKYYYEATHQTPLVYAYSSCVTKSCLPLYRRCHAGSPLPAAFDPFDQLSPDSQRFYLAQEWCALFSGRELQCSIIKDDKERWDNWRRAQPSASDLSNLCRRMIRYIRQPCPSEPIVIPQCSYYAFLFLLSATEVQELAEALMSVAVVMRGQRRRVWFVLAQSIYCAGTTDVHSVGLREARVTNDGVKQCAEVLSALATSYADETMATHYATCLTVHCRCEQSVFHAMACVQSRWSPGHQRLPRVAFVQTVGTSLAHAGPNNRGFPRIPHKYYRY